MTPKTQFPTVAHQRFETAYNDFAISKKAPNQAMETGIEYSQVLIANLKFLKKGDLKEMASALQDQNGAYYSKFRLIPLVYYALRGGHYEENQADKFTLKSDNQYDEECEKPYFTRGTEQHKWRMYWNHFCYQLEGILPHCSEQFQNLFKPDLQEKTFQPDLEQLPK